MTRTEKADLQQAVKEAVAEAHEKKLEEIVEKQLPLAIGEVLGPMIHSAVRADFRRYRRMAVVGYLVLFLGLGYTVHDNRERSTTTRSVLCQIITSGDSTAYSYEREGTITRRQRVRALRQSAEYRALLGPAPACSTALTPPPRNPPPVP